MAEDYNQNKIREKNDTTKTIDSSETLFEINAEDITIITVLSQGRDYNVFKGLYKKKPVAVKTSYASAYVDVEKERFIRQVKILKRLNHCNIVKFVGASVKDGDVMMIVSEFVEDSYNVQCYLKDNMQKELSSVVSIALMTSTAMTYLHSQGIMHGSLSPSNLLVAPHVFKLTGFSNAIEDGTKALRKEDVLDFGQLLSQLLKSFTANQPKHLNFNCLLDLPSSQEDKIPESLLELVDACLSDDPAKRPEFTLIVQNLDSILSTINRVGQLDLLYGGLIFSDIPAPSYFEETYTSMVLDQNTAESIEATPSEAASSMSGEQMDGGTLEEYMLQLKPDVPNNRTAIRFALGISEAMQQLHAQGISHRDLKSSHVNFMTKDKDCLSLGGLEQASEEKTEEMEIKHSKPDEMDLEHFKADVYSFSQIIWELLTNNHTPFQAYASSIEEKRPILEGVPNEMLELLMSCGSEKAEERPTFTQITDTLTKLLSENSQLPKQNAFGSNLQFKKQGSSSSMKLIYEL